MMLSTRLTVIAFLAATWCWTSEGKLYYDVACPGVNSELQCPKGQEIEVLSVQQGVKSSADCAARKYPATVSNNNCIKPTILGLAKFVCNRMERCRLPKPSKRMFACDYSEDNFIQVTYNCNVKTANVAVVCEDKTAEIKCENGVLNIVKASFGRFDRNTCTETPSKIAFCMSPTAGRTVRNMCHNKKSCTITATADDLGKPRFCGGAPKYLTVDYVCQ